MKTGKIVKEYQPRPHPTSGTKTSIFHKRWQPQEHAGKASLNKKTDSKENLKKQNEAQVSANSRRKLEFKEKQLPLLGKKIYLDLKGVKQEKKVEEKLEKLGATIEKFLSKEIHYFVTNQDKEKSKNEDQSPNGSPNMSISSPFNSGHTPSPSSLEKKTFTVTRGKAMLQCAKMDTAADNIVEKAKKLGVKIVPYLSLMKWLIKEQSLRISERKEEAPPSAKKAKVDEISKSKKLLCKARTLKHPFLKFEASNKYFRPVQLEFTSWPYIKMDSAQESCPFDDWLLNANPASSSKQEAATAAAAKLNKRDVTGHWSSESEAQPDMPKRCQKAKKKVGANQPVQPQVLKKPQSRKLSNWERRKLAEKKLRQGFCECCEIRFDDVKKHLNSSEHLSFVKNESNYDHLDSLITNGYNVQQFISKVSNRSKNFSENSCNSVDYSSSPGRIVLLTLTSSTSTHVNPPKVPAENAFAADPATPANRVMTSESEPMPSAASSSSSSSSPHVSSSSYARAPDKTLVANSPCEHPSNLRDFTMQTPVKADRVINTVQNTTSSSAKVTGRNPLKCLLNSPSRLAASKRTDKSAPVHPRASLKAAFLFPSAPSRSLNLPDSRQHPKNVELGPERGNHQNENLNPDRVSECLPPLSLQRSNFDQTQLSVSQQKLGTTKLEKGSVESAAALLSPQRRSTSLCLTPEQSLPKIAGKSSLSPPLEKNGSDLKRLACSGAGSGISFKRSHRYSAGKSKSQRLFKLGEKWQVLSQQSVKKILFGDESPEPFTGFDPQDLFRNSDNSDISYETVSEVVLTDPSEFEWVLGNCEGKQVGAGVHSDPSSSSQAYNPKKCVLTLGDVAMASWSTPQDRQLTEKQNNNNNNFFSREEEEEEIEVEDDKSFSLESSDNRSLANSESPKNCSDDTRDVYLGSHKDFPPYIPNGQMSGYCSPSFPQNPVHPQPSVRADKQLCSVDSFETKVVQDLDYSQTPRYLHLESICPTTSIHGSGFNCPPLNCSQQLHTFQYSDSDHQADPNTHPIGALHNYSPVFDELDRTRPCSLASIPDHSLGRVAQEGTTQTPKPNSDAHTPIYRQTSPFACSGEYENLNETPSQVLLPNLSYEYSSLSGVGTKRTPNETDQDLHTPPDPPLASSNGGSGNQSVGTSFEAIPVLNFDSSFNLPVQNFPILTDFHQSDDTEEKHLPFVDFTPGLVPRGRDPQVASDFKIENKSPLNIENSVVERSYGSSSIQKDPEEIASNFKIENKSPLNIENSVVERSYGSSSIQKDPEEIASNFKIENKLLLNMENSTVEQFCDDGCYIPKDTDPEMASGSQTKNKSPLHKENSTIAQPCDLGSKICSDKISLEDDIEISYVNINGDNSKNEIKFYNDNSNEDVITKTTTPSNYVNSHLESPSKVACPETLICTAETHSLISSLSQTEAVTTAPLKMPYGNPPEYSPGPSSANEPSKNLIPAQQKEPPSPESVSTNKMPRLGGTFQPENSPLPTPPSQSNRCSPKISEIDDLDLPPQLQLEPLDPQPPFPLDPPDCQLAPPQLIPEVILKSPSPLDTAGKEACTFFSPPSDQSSPSLLYSANNLLPDLDLATCKDEDDFLKNCARNLENCTNDVTTDCSVCSAESKYKGECLCSSTPTDSVVLSKQWDIKTTLDSVTSSFDFAFNKKKPSPSGVLSVLSSNSSGSHPPAQGVSLSFKSESEMTDSSLSSSQRLIIEGMDTSDDPYPTSECNGLKNDSGADIKDSGFLSIEELTPKKSPPPEMRSHLPSLKKVCQVARPCSVVLEKTPEVLLVHSLRFPLQKAVDQQNTFSVKRVDNLTPGASPSSGTQPRLLKRLSDNQKTFRLDYIHGHSGGRRNASRTLRNKTRSNIKQNHQKPK